MDFRWQKSAEEYDALWRHEWQDLQTIGPVHRHHRREILELAAQVEFASVLDVGCGAGHLLTEIQRRWPEAQCAGTDVSQAALARASERISAELFPWDFSRGAPPRSFDLVLCTQVVEHVTEDQVFLENLRSVTNRAAIVSSMQGRMRPSEAKIGHVRNYRRGELAAKMEQAGFRVLEVRNWGFPFYSPLFRDLLEWLPEGSGTGKMNGFQRALAAILYHVYRLNWPGKGDVVTVMAGLP